MDGDPPARTDTSEERTSADATPVIPTNMRMLAILEAVARHGTPVTPTEINARMGLPKPTIHRLFTTLEEERFLQREIDGRSYSPGPRMNRLAVETVSAVRVRGARLAVMNRIATEIGETCNLAIPDRDMMIYLDRVETHWPLRIQLPVGTRVPLHATASGKLYLASLGDQRRERYITNVTLERHTANTLIDPDALREELAIIRRRDHSTDDEEFMDGMIAVAVPIRDRQNCLFATLAVHAPKIRMDLEAALAHLPALHRAAGELAGIVNGGSRNTSEA